MTIEEKVFLRKRFVPEAMLAYGFIQTDAGYVYKTDFMDGDFSVILTADDEHGAAGTVYDNMNGEVYTPLRAERFDGAYVNTVRSAYEELLNTIAEQCCTDVLFVSNQANRMTDRTP